MLLLTAKPTTPKGFLKCIISAKTNLFRKLFIDEIDVIEATKKGRSHIHALVALPFALPDFPQATCNDVGRHLGGEGASSSRLRGDAAFCLLILHSQLGSSTIFYPAPPAMRALAFILLTSCLPCRVMAEPPHPDWADLAAGMSGEYTVVGRMPDSSTTYSGHLSFQAKGKKLAFVRTINGQTSRGTASFDTVAGYDHIPVLRLRFVLAGHLYHGIYQWKGDYDNYLRLTGYVYSPNDTTKSPGLEAFFPLPPLVRD